MDDEEQPVYPCGYCKTPVVNNIWCSEECREKWYVKERFEEMQRRGKKEDWEQDL